MKTKQNLFSKKELLDIFVNHPPDSSFAGDWEGILKGTGYEFYDLREMEASDPLKIIDWKATAKTGRYHVREYLAETHTCLMILYDISKSVAFGRKELVQANIAASLAYTALKRNHKFGLILFADKVTACISPGMGYEHFIKVIDTVVQAKPENCLQTDLNKALERLARESRESLTFILSDFTYLPEHHLDFQSSGSAKIRSAKIRPAKTGHEIIALRIAEQSELSLPPDSKGIISIYDYETGKYALLDMGRWKEYNKYMKDKSDCIKNIFNQAGIIFETITAQDNFRTKIHESIRKINNSILLCYHILSVNR